MIDYTTFFSIWYWATVALFWTALCRTPFGLSPETLEAALADAELASEFASESGADPASGSAAAAARDGAPPGPLAAAAATVVRAHAARTDRLWNRWGLAAAAIAGFTLAALAMAGPLGGWRPATGLLLLLLPGGAAVLVALNHARALHDAAARPEGLSDRTALLQAAGRRRGDQTMAMLGTALAAAWFMLDGGIALVTGH